MNTTKQAVMIFYMTLILAMLACKSSQTENLIDSDSALPATEPTIPTAVAQKPTNQLVKTKTSSPVPTKIPTKKTTSTRVPTSIPSVDFSLLDANRVPPDDIFQEVHYFGQGGGPCSDPYPVPGLENEDVESADMLMPSIFLTCGWQEKEKIQVIVRFPNGSDKVFSIQANDLGDATYEFKPTLNDKLGLYIFIFSGKSGKFETTVRYIKPKGARLLPLDETHLMLYGFAPRESVRLFCYDIEKDTLLGWQKMSVDKNGVQVVLVDFAKCNFAILGKLSGEVHFLRFNYNLARLADWGPPIKRAYCGGLRSRIYVNIPVRIAYTDGTKMRVRAKPGFSQPTLLYIPEGNFIRIESGPKCVDHSIWWQVSVYNKDRFITGWMTEEQNGVYLLEPTP